MVSGARQLADRLKVRPGVKPYTVRFFAFSDEDYATVVSASLSRGMWFAFRSIVIRYTAGAYLLGAAHAATSRSNASRVRRGTSSGDGLLRGAADRIEVPAGRSGS